MDFGGLSPNKQYSLTIEETQVSEGDINSYKLGINGKSYPLYSLLDDLNPTQTGAYKVDLMTGIVTTSDGGTLTGIFKSKLPDLVGITSISLEFSGEIRNKKIELMEVI